MDGRAFSECHSHMTSALVGEGVSLKQQMVVPEGCVTMTVARGEGV